MAKIRTYKERLEKYREMNQNGCWLYQQAIRKDGYSNFITLVDSKWKNQLAHRVAYWVYKGDSKGKMVLHRCDVRNCINPDHLFLGTHSDNMQDAARKHHFKRDGENNGNSKLDEAKVKIIRKMYKEGTKREKLAKMFNINSGTVWFIVENKTWRNVD